VIIQGSAIRFDDRLRGPQCQDLRTSCGDFIIRRRDGSYAYHLATVVDDAAAEVTEVVRGSDLLDSTPRQIYLQRLLQLPTPSYCHTPLVIAGDGRKLSKQNSAPSIDSLKPSDGLITVLEMLRQHPPPGLKKAAAKEILKWAMHHWDVSRLGEIDDLQVA
jgi:glutamyl-Q tRNA(Asp) synthetase